MMKKSILALAACMMFLVGCQSDDEGGLGHPLLHHLHRRHVVGPRRFYYQVHLLRTEGMPDTLAGKRWSHDGTTVR